MRWIRFDPMKNEYWLQVDGGAILLILSGDGKTITRKIVGDAYRDESSVQDIYQDEAEAYLALVQRGRQII